MAGRRTHRSVAFNDHMESIVKSSARPRKRAQMVERCGISNQELIDWLRASSVVRTMSRRRSRVWRRRRFNHVRMLSHDDASPRCEGAFGHRASALRNFRSMRKPRAKPLRG